MAKIMLVEDDNNLREIYGARLQAEGHDIVAAKDGEEALALAVKEKPELIISDVMMPRISGFDMLDILRNAPETKETKVIMMTALSQAEDKARADKLGADRYLVKSQVTLEDVANVVREVLEGTSESAEPTPPEPAAPAVSPDTPAADVEAVTKPTPDTGAEPTAEPAPEPMLAPAPVPESAPEPAAPTIEVIANPVVEVHNEPDLSQVQAPPNEEPESATIPGNDTSTPDPEPVSEVKTEAEPGAVEVAEQESEPAPAPAPEPVPPEAPEPATANEQTPAPEPAPVTPIKVELPQVPGAATEQAAAEPVTTPAPPVVEPEVQQPDTDETAFVGPNLAEALASEENTSTKPSGTPEAGQAGLTIPVVSDEVPAPTAPQSTAPEPTRPEQTAAEPKTEAKDTGVSTEGSNNTTAGMRVIQPISDPAASPDINELLAAEERNAAVENPTANTVFTPGDPAQESTPEPESTPAPAPQKPDTDNPVNNIAL